MAAIKAAEFIARRRGQNGVCFGRRFRVSYREYDLHRPVIKRSLAGYYLTRLFWIAVLLSAGTLVWGYQAQIRSAFGAVSVTPKAKKKTHQAREAEAMRKEERKSRIKS